MRDAYRRGPGGHVELGEDALGVGAQRVERDVELAGDLRSGELAVEKPEHLQFAVTQRVILSLLRLSHHLDGGPPALDESLRLRTRRVVRALDHLLQEGQHGGSLVQVQPHVTVRLRRADKTSAKCGERLPPLTPSVVRQSLQHPDLAHAAVPSRLRRRAGQPVEKSEYDTAVGVLTSPVLGQQQPDQGQVLVLVQVVRPVIDADRPVLGPGAGRRQIPSSDPDPGP